MPDSLITGHECGKPNVPRLRCPLFVACNAAARAGNDAGCLIVDALLDEQAAAAAMQAAILAALAAGPLVYRELAAQLQVADTQAARRLFKSAHTVLLLSEQIVKAGGIWTNRNFQTLWALKPASKGEDNANV